MPAIHPGFIHQDGNGFSASLGNTQVSPSFGSGQPGDLLIVMARGWSTTAQYYFPAGWTAGTAQSGQGGYAMAVAWAVDTTGADQTVTVTSNETIRWGMTVHRIRSWADVRVASETDLDNVRNVTVAVPGGMPRSGPSAGINWLVAFPSGQVINTGPHDPNTWTGNLGGGEQRFGFSWTHFTGSQYSPGVWNNADVSRWNTTAAIHLLGLTDPVASYTWAQRQGQTVVDYTDTSAETAPYATSWAWDFGDGLTSTDQHPVHTYAQSGTFTVSLTVTTAAGSSTTSQTVTVAPQVPTAQWTWLQVSNTLGALLIDQSLDADSWLWEVYATADGSDTPTTYTTPDVLHDWGAQGAYLVRLTVTNVTGSDTSERVVSITIPPEVPTRPDGLKFGFQFMDPNSGQWRDVQCALLEAGWAWGAVDDQGLFNRALPSILNARFWDPDRTLDPMNPDSALFPWQAQSTLVRAELEGSQVWVGSLESVTWDSDSRETAIQGMDNLLRLSAIDVDADGALNLPAQSVDERMTALLDLASWPSNSRSISPDGTQLKARTVAEANVWSTMYSTAVDGAGSLFVAQDGRVAYVDFGTAWAERPVDLHLGCDGEAPIRRLSTRGDSSIVRNYISVMSQGDSSPTVRQDQDSLDRFGKRTAVWHDSSLLYPATWADRALERHRRPSYVTAPVEFDLVNSLVALKVALSTMTAVWRITDDHHGGLIDITGRLLGLEYVVTAQSITVRGRVAVDPVLLGEYTQALIDTDTEWLVGDADAVLQDADNAQATPTGQPAALQVIEGTLAPPTLGPELSPDLDDWTMAGDSYLDGDEAVTVTYEAVAGEQWRHAARIWMSASLLEPGKTYRWEYQYKATAGDSAVQCWLSPQDDANTTIESHDLMDVNPDTSVWVQFTADYTIPAAANGRTQTALRPPQPGGGGECRYRHVSIREVLP